MSYRERQPALPLRAHVACYWTLTGANGPSAGPRRVLPDGCADLLIDLGDGSARWIGTMTRPLEVVPSDRVELLGVRFRAGGLRGFLGAPLTLITDGDADVAALVAQHWQPPLSALLDASGFEQRCRCLDASLTGALRRLPGGALPVWLAALERNPWSADVGALAERSGLGVRTLERRFLDFVGVSPRQHLRYLRFERARRLLAQRTLALADIAVAAGYADQPHLTRDFVRFTGQSPRRFIG